MVKRPGHIQRTRQAERLARMAVYLVRQPRGDMIHGRETVAVTQALYQRGGVATGDALAAALAQRAPPIAMEPALRAAADYVAVVTFVSRAAAAEAQRRGNPYLDLSAARADDKGAACPLCGQKKGAW